MYLKKTVKETDLRRVRDLYERAFPEDEKKPFSMITEGQKRGDYEILSLLGERDQFLALAIMVQYADCVLLDYLAVSEDCRCMGAGSSALTLLKERYPDKRLIVEIEHLEPTKITLTEEEAARRKRRREFYLRNALQPVGYLVELFGVEMEILTYDKPVSYEEYHSVLEHVLPENLIDRVKFLRFL